ncbi:MAG: serine/threonine-protein kinase [Phycisphaerae bacterium]|nr:serine/threonine-protein kinase [Phycisphaerae bacterium]
MHPTDIGPFKVERELGRGGMGEVYLAHDSRLDRHVAIKALPVHLAQEPERLARFQREAKVLASLNHPNIGAIFGLEESASRQYLILEFIDGETLGDRLINGPVPVDEALSLAKQIAEALEAAHEKGVVHRDLKPSNVMVNASGQVKVLDFGLARTAEGTPTSTGLVASPDSPTMPVNSPTIPGAIMGTAGYMSPEQARGKPVDKRSDIFSFGCVLYEMLTGAGPFPGETVTDSLGAILHREPDWSLLPPRTPSRVRELLRSCLAKDRRNRLHDMGDARLELDRAISGQEWASTPHVHRATRVTPLRLALAAVAGAVLLGAGWLVGQSLHRPEPPPPAQVFHVSTAVPAKPEFNSVVGIAPDARFVVYKAWPQLEPDSTKPPGILVVRRLDCDETKVIDGTEGITSAALSPDARWLAFAATKDQSNTKITLKKITLDNGRPTGTPETLCDLPAGGEYTLCWSSDREIVLAAGWQQSILAVAAAGGEPRVVLKEEQSKGIDVWGELRPLVPGKSILATRWAIVGQTIKERVEVVDLAAGTRTPLLTSAGGAQLIPGGFIIARRNQNTLIAARVDLNTLQIVGEPVTVWTGGNASSFFISESGTLAMLASPTDLSGRRLALLDAQGQPQPVAVPPRAYSAINVSPDGGRVVTNLESPDLSGLPSELGIQDLSRATFRKFSTQGPSFEFHWSNDGQRIVYTSVASDGFSIWQRRADGSGEAEKVYASPNAQEIALPSAWSPDGKILAIVQTGLTSAAGDVLMLEQEAGSPTWRATPYLNSPSDEHALRFSPDGKWVIFCSVESGRHELYAQRFTGAGSGEKDAASGRVQLSSTGHNGACWWSQDGKEIRYIDGDQQVMSVEVQTEPTFSASLPKKLYSLKELKSRNFSWTPDGRLMVILPGENEQVTKVDLVVNFIDEVRAKLPPSK